MSMQSCVRRCFCVSLAAVCLFIFSSYAIGQTVQYDEAASMMKAIEMAKQIQNMEAQKRAMQQQQELHDAKIKVYQQQLEMQQLRMELQKEKAKRNEQ